MQFSFSIPGRAVRRPRPAVLLVCDGEAFRVSDTRARKASLAQILTDADEEAAALRAHVCLAVEVDGVEHAALLIQQALHLIHRLRDDVCRSQRSAAGFGRGWLSTR